jgi:hypothetical protein
VETEQGKEQGKEQGIEVVGYGRPPAATRFKPGQSGNPKGRPRGRSLTTILRQSLDKTEIRGVSLGGATVGEVLIESMLAQAIIRMREPKKRKRRK